MHRNTEETEKLARAIVDYALDRMRMDPPPLGRTVPSAELRARAGRTITAEGLGAAEALRIFTEVVGPAAVSTDHPAYLAYVPAAPTKSSILFELVVGASAIIGSGWIDGGGGIWAENEALRWVADLIGLGPEAGGCFVSGGSAGNLSALVAARHAAAVHRGNRPTRWKVVASQDVHSSVLAAARVMDVEVVPVSADRRGRLTGEAVAATLARSDPDGIFAVVATAGTTNSGVIDDLAGIAAICRQRALWFHVDAAYGGAALCAPSVRDQFAGIDRADSVVVDPHKWLFAPYDCCALIYADPSVARAAFTQRAGYLEDANAVLEWNPMHYAFHLTRRVRGLPFWFSLAVHGTDAYRSSVETVLAITRRVADAVRRRPNVELVAEPQLSIVLFRRVGWNDEEHDAWCARLLAKQVAFVLPTTWRGERVLRFCFVNPTTTFDRVAAILDTLG
jgi:L-2,4-diaminobutyrate decarboxylase